MRMIDCLSQFPDDMLFIDLVETDEKKRIKSIAELKAKLPQRELESEGYEVREHAFHYGKVKRKSIGLIGGYNFYNEAQSQTR